jgi:Domain of unknown function (DUF4375)
MAPGEKPGDKYRSLVATVWDAIDIDKDPAVFLTTFHQARRKSALLYAAYFCQYEICNGGFYQFFHNAAGVLAPEAIEGFSAIGQTQIADVVRQAMSVLDTPYVRECDSRRDSLPSGDTFGEFDKRFYGLIDTEAGGFDVAADHYAVLSGA